MTQHRFDWLADLKSLEKQKHRAHADTREAIDTCLRGLAEIESDADELASLSALLGDDEACEQDLPRFRDIIYRPIRLLRDALSDASMSRRDVQSFAEQVRRNHESIGFELSRQV